MEMTTSGTEINKNHRGASVNKTAEMTRMALMVAMNCVSAYIIIPLPFSLSPIALQTLIVNLTGYVLNAKQAFMTMLVYLLVGLAGVPVFTGGSAGPGKLFGPTGGYIIGFCLPLCSWHISEAKNTASSVTLCLAALSVFR